MAHTDLHEAERDLQQETLDMHRALVSLQEELEAVDWYRQRADACHDAALKEIMLHNMTEEIEHASMLIEWLRRRNEKFNATLQAILFSEANIHEIESAEK